MLSDAGIESAKLPSRSPHLNAHAERFVRNSKILSERLILFRESSLRTAIQNFVAYYDRERIHQGLGNELSRREHDHLAKTGGSLA
jgi:transposase InsO family protein